jgi:thymidylate synthase (FAD)
MTTYVYADKIGSLRLVDSMGSDASIVNAARISYTGQRPVSDDAALIRYLLRHEHMTPFEMVTFQFHVVAPLFVARQWMRHRTASINEQSARYSVLENRFYIPEEAQVCLQSSTNKQGRDPSAIAQSSTLFVQKARQLCAQSYQLYEEALESGISREVCRMILPVNIYTQFVWQSNLRNIMHFVQLRADPHAQWEIQQYANVMHDIVASICPIATKAFDDYCMGALSFSVPELKLLPRPLQLTGMLANKREQQELESKIAQLNL